jgi:hypothetical protein
MDDPTIALLAKCPLYTPQQEQQQQHTAYDPVQQQQPQQQPQTQLQQRAAAAESGLERVMLRHLRTALAQVEVADREDTYAGYVAQGLDLLLREYVQACQQQRRDKDD